MEFSDQVLLSSAANSTQNVAADFSDESCVAFHVPKEDPIVGIFGEGTLDFFRLTLLNASAVAIKGKYFFVLYHDQTRSRNVDEYNSPRSPILTTAILFYARPLMLFSEKLGLPAEKPVALGSVWAGVLKPKLP
jgi:hypothetical protein